MSLDWINYQKLVDQKIDDIFGEPVEFYPWLAGDYSHPGGADPSRPIKVVTAIPVTPGAGLTGEKGLGGNVGQQYLESELWISVTEDELGDVSQWKKHDRVRYRTGVWFEINYIAPSATRRPNVHLIRIQDTTSPAALVAKPLINHPPVLGRPTVAL